MAPYFSLCAGALLWMLGVWIFRKAFGARVCVLGRIVWSYLAGILMGMSLYIYFSYTGDDLPIWFLIIYLLFMLTGFIIMRRTVATGMAELDERVVNFYRAMLLRHAWQLRQQKKAAQATRNPEADSA